MLGEALVIGVSSACALEEVLGAATALTVVLGVVFQFGDGSREKKKK